MNDVHDIELQRNFEYFQSILSNIIADHANQFALLRKQTIVAYYPKAIDAMTEGTKQFSDGLFSVQRVSDRPLDLGFLSYGADNRVSG